MGWNDIEDGEVACEKIYDTIVYYRSKAATQKLFPKFTLSIIDGPSVKSKATPFFFRIKGAHQPDDPGKLTKLPFLWQLLYFICFFTLDFTRKDWIS